MCIAEAVITIFNLYVRRGERSDDGNTNTIVTGRSRRICRISYLVWIISIRNDRMLLQRVIFTNKPPW